LLLFTYFNYPALLFPANTKYLMVMRSILLPS
jgi:hypothetical protein